MTRKTLGRKLSLLLTVTALGSVAALAQSTTQGAITGTVFDTTNATVPGAQILIHNNATNQEQKLLAGGAGEFKAPGLTPGQYTVTITANGFQPVRSTNVTVEVNETTEFDEHLKIGGNSEVVEVNAAAPVLNFESAEYGGHLENTEIEAIPVNNRRWSTLALLTPGATVDTNGYGLISFRAISPLLNNVEIDGADDNQAFFSEERGRTRAGYSTSQAMVQEFQVNAGVYSAEFGRAVGGVVNSVTKSGGNQIHGEAYFYNRKSSRAAFVPLNSTITTYNAATGLYTTTPYKPSDNRNEFGFQAGGALMKDKLFWAYAFDMYRRNFPGTATAASPGTFFAAPSAATLTTLAARLGTTSAAAGTLYNNQLQALLGDLGPVPRFGDQEINTPKLDYQLNSKEHVSVLYHRLRWDSPGGVQTQGTNTYAVDSFGTDFVKLDYTLAKLDSLITNRLTNEVRYQYGRELDDEGQQPLSAYSKNFLTAGGNTTYADIYHSVGFYAGSPYYSYRVAYPDERKWQIGDTGHYVIGKHDIRFGEDFVHNYDLQNNLYESNGAYVYGSILNYMSDVLSGGKGTCDSSASTTGPYPCYSSYTQSFGQPILAMSTQDWGVFLQDDWKITPHLTMNAGVRYDYEKLPPPFAPNPLIPQTTTTPSDKNNVGPRLGFAWDPFGQGKTTVHAGAGVYYGRIFNAALLNALENTGAGISATGGKSTSQAAYSYSSTSGGPILPNYIPVTSTTTLPITSPTTNLPSIEYLDPNLQNPYTEQFDMAVQQELWYHTVLSISYIGALGRELPNYLNLNLNPGKTYTIPYTITAGTNGSCGPVACGTVIPVKVYAAKEQLGPTASNYTYAGVVQNSNYNGITDVVSNLNSSYHGVTVEVQRRSGKYIQFDSLYTWSHALDFNQSIGTSFTAGSNNWFDPYANARANYGNSLENVTHRVVAWALITAPGVSAGSKWAYLANGWSLKPLIQAQSGLPYSISTTGTTPNQCSVATCLEVASSGIGGTGVTYIPALGRNTRKYPNVAVADGRLEKDFTFREKYNLQLFGEVFNLANHQNVTVLNTTGYAISSTLAGTTTGQTTSKLTYQPTFGTPTAVNSTYAYGPRQIQISARVQF